jgi:hypothetical protein
LVSFLFSACSETPNNDNIVLTLPTEVLTYSHSPFLDEATKELLVNSSQLSHTFSDGTQLSLHAIGDHIFPLGTDIALSLRRDLPDVVIAYEEFLAGSMSTQGVGFVPGRTNPQYGGTPSLWPSAKNIGVIYYTLGNFPTNLKPLVDKAIADWNASSVAIKLQPKPTSSSWNAYKTLSIIWTSGSLAVAEPILNGLGCNVVPAYTAGIGYQDNGLGFPVGGTIYVNSSCLSYYSAAGQEARLRRTIQHEIGHAVGLWHEHQRCDRDNYVQVTPSSSSPLDVNYYFNFGKRCEVDIKQYGPYDFIGVMSYSYGTSSTGTLSLQPRSTLPYLSYCGEKNKHGQGITLSAGDIYSINSMYGKATSKSICSVSAYPTVATVKSGTAINISAGVQGYNLGNTDKGLTWSISPTTGSGTLTALLNGYSYLAPVVTSAKTVTLTATSKIDSSKKVTIILSIVP